MQAKTRTGRKNNKCIHKFGHKNVAKKKKKTSAPNFTNLIFECPAETARQHFRGKVEKTKKYIYITKNYFCVDKIIFCAKKLCANSIFGNDFAPQKSDKIFD